MVIPALGVPVAAVVPVIENTISNRTRIGGRKRHTPLIVEELTNLDLEEVNLGVHANANRIYLWMYM